jgi:hypothetical protein
MLNGDFQQPGMVAPVKPDAHQAGGVFEIELELEVDEHKCLPA